jgi:serine/threonine protein kinase
VTAGALKICPQCGTEYELDQRFCPKDGTTLKVQGGAQGDLVGTIIADRYNVLRKLGEGGMGTVYLAEHVKMGRKSAVKVMNPGMVHDADAISRFNREAANASRINHPNVAAVYDFGETSDGLIYLAMEFVEGPALTKVIEGAGCLAPLRAAEITRQAAEALAVAHDMGIVHRDLKPDNIMLTKSRDGTDIVKVVDFGIAKAANVENQKVTKTGLVVGTPEYMSPEQLAGDKLDGRSDIYSLALVTFAMMTGKLPFPAATVQESMIMRLTDQPKRLLEMKSDVAWPAEVQAVLDKALERDAEARYQSASEYGRDLHRTVSAMPESSIANAFTSVMGRMSTPKKPSPVIPPPAGKTAPMPATRINPSTPARPIPSAAVPSKSKTPLFAGIGAVVVAGIAFGAYTVMNNTKTAGATDTASGNVAALNQSVTPPEPAVDLPRTFRTLDSLTDITKDANEVTAQRALALLDSASKYISADSDLVHADYVRANALFLSGEDVDSKKGCDVLRNIEGRASRTRFKAPVEAYLYDDKKKGLKAACS